MAQGGGTLGENADLSRSFSLRTKDQGARTRGFKNSKTQGVAFAIVEFLSARVLLHLHIRREELQLLRCKGRVSCTEGFFQVRDFLGPDDRKDRKRLPEQIA
jgi:hypothetical protein